MTDFEVRGERFWKALDRTARAWEPKFADKARELFAQELKALRKLLRKGEKQANWVSLGTDIEAVLRARTGNWREGFIALFELLLGAQAEEWSAQFGIDFTLENPEVQRFIEDYSFKFAQKISDTTVEDVRRLTSTAQSEGWGVLKMRDELTKVYDGWSVVRAEMIARSETIRSSNAGALASYQASGVVRGKRWYTAEDERVCPFCGALHGNVVEVLDQPWYRVGDVLEVEGQRLKIGYEDVKHPPLHPMCRCTLLPVVLGEVAQPVVGLNAAEARARISEIDREWQQERASLLNECDRLNAELREAARRDDRARYRDLTNQHHETVGRLLQIEERRHQAISEATYVKDPAKFKTRQISKVAKERREAWDRGVADFRKMVSSGLMDDATIDLKAAGRGRSYYTHNRINLTTGARENAVIHELGHALEAHNPEVLRKALEFYDERTAGEIAKWLGDDFRPDEKGRKDKFIRPYMGKDYGGRATEIVSMGLEYMRKDPVRLSKEDPGYFDFIYNLARGR